MTRDEAIELVMNRLGNRAGDTALEAAAVKEIQQVQRQLEGNAELPWFCLTYDAPLTTTTTTHTISVPDDFLLAAEDEELWLVETDGDEVPLDKEEPDLLRDKYVRADAGQPVAYALIGDKLWFGPKPDAAYSLKFSYFAKQTSLATDVENSWLKHASDLMIGELGLILAEQYLYNDKARAAFERQVQRARNRLDNLIATRELVNRRMQMGDPN